MSISRQAAEMKEQMKLSLRNFMATLEEKRQEEKEKQGEDAKRQKGKQQEEEARRKKEKQEEQDRIQGAKKQL